MHTGPMHIKQWMMYEKTTSLSPYTDSLFRSYMNVNVESRR